MEVEPASDDWGYELVTHRIVPPTMCDSKGVIDMATQDTGGIKELRDAADRGREAIQEREQLKREMAFMKAGVDTDSKAGQLLFKAYDGELETEAIQAEWQELVPTSAPVEQPEQAQDPVNEADTQVSQQRQALAEDSVSVEAGTQSPYEQGFQEFKKAYDAGTPKEDSAARFVHTVLEAAGQGDERVIDGR